MIERFFLDRIHMFSANLAVYEAIEDACPVFADTADSPSAVFDQAMEPTQATPHLVRSF
jgi:hypothetical protein